MDWKNYYRLICRYLLYFPMITSDFLILADLNTIFLFLLLFYPIRLVARFHYAFTSDTCFPDYLSILYFPLRFQKECLSDYQYLQRIQINQFAHWKRYII